MIRFFALAASRESLNALSGFPRAGLKAGIDATRREFGRLDTITFFANTIGQQNGCQIPDYRIARAAASFYNQSRANLELCTDKLCGLGMPNRIG